MSVFKPLAFAMLAALGTSISPAEESHRAVVGDVEVSLPQLARFAAVETGGEPHAWLEVHNSAETRREVRLEWTVTPAGGESAEPRVRVLPVPAGETARVEIAPDDIALFGLHEVGFHLTVGDQVSERAVERVAVYPRNRPAARGESVFPIGSATGAPRATPRLLELAASLGFEYHRFNAVWNDVQPREGVWHWGPIDRHLALVESHGMRWHVMTAGSASWAADERFAPPRLDAWKTWIGALAERYGDRIEFWEIWNEPNISFFKGTVEEYGELQRAAFDAIKAAAPQVVVTSGGYAGINHHASRPGAFEAAFRDYPRAYDWFAYHMHDTFPQFRADISRQLAGIMRRVGRDNVPMVFTETGFDTRFGERFQAETLLKKMTYASAIGAKSYTWYNLMDRSGRDQPNKPGYTFGLITNPTGTADFASIESELRPKPSFVSAAVAIRELRGRVHRETWAEDGRRFAYLFEGRGDHMLIGWTEGGDTPGASWVVETDATSVESMDLFGNVTPLPVVDGRVVVALDTPRYHRFVGATKAPHLVGPLLELTGRPALAADGAVTAEFALRNPFARELRVNLAVDGEGFVTKTPAEERVIAPEGVAHWTVRLATQPGALGETRVFTTRLSGEQLPWRIAMPVAVTFDTIDAVRGQRLVVGDQLQVTNKRDHDPYSLHLLWGSPADLSARVDIRADEAADTLSLTLEVTDNVHHVTGADEPLLDGDAVELGWALASGGTARIELAGQPGGEPRVRVTASEVLRVERALRSAQISRDGKVTVYRLELSPTGMGLGEADRANGFRFNFAVHDNDGEGAKSWLSPLPGLGGANRFEPSTFPRIRLRP